MYSTFFMRRLPTIMVRNTNESKPDQILAPKVTTTPPSCALMFPPSVSNSKRVVERVNELYVPLMPVRPTGNSLIDRERPVTASQQLNLLSVLSHGERLVPRFPNTLCEVHVLVSLMRVVSTPLMSTAAEMRLMLVLTASSSPLPGVLVWL